MKFLIILFSALAAVGALPTEEIDEVFDLTEGEIFERQSSTLNTDQVRVTVGNTPVNFRERLFTQNLRGPAGQFRTVKIDLGPNVVNKNLRCRIFRNAGTARGDVITVDRGAANINRNTFSAGGAWTFNTPRSSPVFRIQCPAVENRF